MCVQVVCVCVGGWVLCVNERVCERVCVCVCVCVWGDLHTRSAVAPRRMLRRLSPCISAACSRCSRSDRTSASLNALGFALPPSLSRTSAHTHTHTHTYTHSLTHNLPDWLSCFALPGIVETRGKNGDGSRAGGRCYERCICRRGMCVRLYSSTVQCFSFHLWLCACQSVCVCGDVKSLNGISEGLSGSR